MNGIFYILEQLGLTLMRFESENEALKKRIEELEKKDTK